MLRHKVQPLSEHNVTSENNVGQEHKKIPADLGTCEPLTKDQHHSDANYFQEIFGFQTKDLVSLDRLVRLLCRPTDPASLGTLRFCFGLLMILDVFQERGLAVADSWWGSDEQCRFPFFHFLQPLPLQWMYIVYLVMLSGAIGIMLGFKLRLSSAFFLASYWYIFFLDKTAWNNHSYLFGILAFLLAICDANRYWSVDGFLYPEINNSQIPVWNYTLIRVQIFIVYFVAGLKKLDADWIYGYPMQSLSSHWMFNPLKTLLTEPQIDLYIIHLGGLVIDLSSGFLLFFNNTRTFGLVLTSTFHLMNSQLFSIGMFPYAMLATQLVFCDTSWPRKYFGLIPPCLRLFTPEDTELQSSSNCVYPKICVKSEVMWSSCSAVHSKTAPPTVPVWKHKLVSLFTIAFIVWQFFLPYSHGITKGYNNWTNGLYGYSWDMMIHSWSVQHIRITYYDKDTGKSGYLHPMVWTGGDRRWSSHGDMIKQYAHCIAGNLKSYNISNVEVHFDIWKSLNYRFQQRMVDPRVDMITADWSPFRHPAWVLPLMTDLSEWRTKLAQIETSTSTNTPTDVVFVADFPGMYLENYIQPDFGNTSITVLAGQVLVELIHEKRNISLVPGDTVQMMANTFHNVHTVSQVPSCYMYTFVNTTEASLMKAYTQFEHDYNKSQSLNETLQKYHQDPNLAQYQQILASKQTLRSEVPQTVWQRFKSFLRLKYNLFRRSIRLSIGAVSCLVTGSSFHEFLNATYKWEATDK